MEAHGRIWFPGNPWPNGHSLKEFVWSGRLDADGSLWFDFHLESVEYDSEGAPAFDHEEDWRCPDVWTNTSGCTLSSTEWKLEGSKGLFLGDAARPFALSSLATARFTADQAPAGGRYGYDLERPPAFWVYLTGHDGVADHRFRFSPTAGRGVYDIEWAGRIALVEVGQTTLDYTFRAGITMARFKGFAVAKELETAATVSHFRRACSEPHLFNLIRSTDPRVIALVEKP
jgi:hypothetical protein